MKISGAHGDITMLDVDVVVNAANSSLLGECKVGEANLVPVYDSVEQWLSDRLSYR